MPIVEHAHPPLRPDQLGHPGHDVRLGDRLTLADRERVIVVGLTAEPARHESMPRDLPHRLEHGAILDPAGLELSLDHVFPPSTRGLLVIDGPLAPMCQDERDAGRGRGDTAEATPPGFGSAEGDSRAFSLVHGKLPR